ncbi:MAG: aspartate aminotransferase family protein [Alphaproteobacteria bacterium]|nr:aspartate aminotransferase family protein [Alphaproteobacteria bacterium]MCB9697547.1 aspartate aminotransferase family protein [Alphaproteobacteria bacterium]
MTDEQDLLTRRAAVMPRGIPRASTVVVDRGEGAHLVDPHGRKYVDLVGGIGVMSVGHSHPEVIEAIVVQARRLQHTCIHIATYEPYVALCERLVALLPHGGPTKAMLVNSGAEAVENAVKIARQATGRSGILCFTGAFHGRTLLGMSLTSKTGYKAGCGPFAPEIYRIPFPDRFHDGDGLSEEAFVARELHRLEEALSTSVAAKDLAAILVEPVLGEGGFLPVPAAWLRGVRDLCDRHGVLLILDEVQTGFCRTGSWGAYQQLGVVPDLSTWAKAMGGGLPISAVLGRAEVMDAAVPGTIGGTYGGNPVACASALATLSVMEQDDLSGRAKVLGARIRARFGALAEKTPLVADVRGMGAMMAIELCEGGDPRKPATATTAAVLAACHERGVLVIGCGVHANVIRVLCPLNIEQDVLDGALTVICEEIERRG